MKLPCKENLRSPSRLLTVWPFALIGLVRQEKTPPGVATAHNLATWMSDPNIRLEITRVDENLSNRLPVSYYLVKKIIDRGPDSIGLSETFVVPVDREHSSELVLIVYFLRMTTTQAQQG